MVVDLKEARIALIGGGKMGEAILGGWISSAVAPADALTPDQFVVADPGAERRDYLVERYHVRCVADATQIKQADIVVLAVKPQVMSSVLETISDEPAFSLGEQGPLFVSIAAGLSTARLESELPAGAHVVRVMPNTPLLVGCGATTVTAGSSASESELALVCDLFACLGSAHIVEERDMDAAGAVSGSGPAYVAAFIEALRDAGASQGLDRELSEQLAFDTLRGTVELMARTGQSAETTRIAVCSPGGTTLAALGAMEEAGFARAIDAGVAAAVRRSKELGAC